MLNQMRVDMMNTAEGMMVGPSTKHYSIAAGSQRELGAYSPITDVQNRMQITGLDPGI